MTSQITWLGRRKQRDMMKLIGHPRDRAPIIWQIGARRTNHDRERCYRYDYYKNECSIVKATVVYDVAANDR